MEKTREVKQERECSCNNWCKNGKPTPCPLSSLDTPDENQVAEYCGNCNFFVWKNVE